MKKLAILLGTLAIAASAFAGGKEVVPDPASPTVIKEVEKVVYRDRGANGGYVEFLYRWFGTAAEDKYDERRQVSFGRLQIQGNVNLTDRDSMYFRVRSHHQVGDSDKKGYSDNTQIRLRASHKHDLLNASSRLHYQNPNEPNGFAVGEHNLEYQFRIPLAEYFFDNDFVKTTAFTLAPKFGFSWDHSGGANRSTYYAGVDLETMHKLPLNFSLEINLRAAQYQGNGYFYDGKKSDFAVAAEVYLYNTTKLLDLGDTSTLSFYFEGGYDTYQWSQRKLYPDSWGKLENAKYSLYALPALRLDIKPSETLGIFVVAGAEWRNNYSVECEASDWTIAPTAWAGFKVTF
jgi:hypothetical protein